MSMSSNKNKRKLVLNRVSVKLGCGSCTRPRLLLSNIFHPKPNNKSPSNYPKHTPSSTSSSWDKHTFSPNTTTTTTTTDDDDVRSSRAVQGFGRIGGQSVAVEKDSDDPYLDFRSSMLQMIMENNIHSKHDLTHLLNCFLHLNSPQHYATIIRAFTHISHEYHHYY